MLAPGLAGPAPSPGPAAVYSICDQGLWASQEAAPWHRLTRAMCLPRGSKWFCTFFKHLFSESTACRLTTEERPPPPCTHVCLLFQLNWEHEADRKSVV